MIGRIFLGRYEAVRLLGEGGMGRVFLAHQLDLGRQVVIKVMHDHIAADEMFRERFQRETLLMARFQHPYAVTLYDASLNDPCGPCIVMEYIRGINMEILLQKNGRLSPQRVGRLIGQLCEVLQAAHEQGMIHRDLKPANLMVVDHDTPREKIKVMDFGLAKLIDPGPMKSPIESSTDFAVGTPGYICPEQVRGEPCDHRSDLYSVGVIMYELLTGRLPFLGPTSMDLMLAHATELPPTFADLELDDIIPSSVEAVVNACMAKQPEDRPQSARELSEMFEAALLYSDDVDSELESSMETGPLPNSPKLVNESGTLSFQLEAWMPESIAVMKLKGFAYDMDGEVIESSPGLVRLRLGASAGNRTQRGGALSWLGFGKRSGPLNLELYFHHLDPQRTNRLLVQVLFRPSSLSALNDSAWRERCTSVFIDLRAYLMGTTEAIH